MARKRAIDITPVGLTADEAKPVVTAVQRILPDITIEAARVEIARGGWLVRVIKPTLSHHFMVSRDSIARGGYSVQPLTITA